MSVMTVAQPRAADASMIVDMAQTDAAHAARRQQGDVTRRAILGELSRRWRDREPAPTWAELGAIAGVTERTALYHGRRLRASGLVAFDDGRARTVMITEAGRALLGQH